MDDAEGGYSGRRVLIVLFVASVVTVVLGLTLIRPDPDSEPAAVNRRPFGPATAEDYDNLPLIEKGRARTQSFRSFRAAPATLPADE